MCKTTFCAQYIYIFGSSYGQLLEVVLHLGVEPGAKTLYHILRTFKNSRWLKYRKWFYVVFYYWIRL